MSAVRPLRRLSVALGLAKAYVPEDCPPNDLRTHSAITADLSDFLVASKASYLKDPSAGDWTVVMGNEAGDLDSIASAIAFAWIQSEVHKVPTIPLVQITREDFALRAENLYALSLAGISDPPSQLLSLSDIASFPTPFPSKKFALVDHNRIADRFMQDNPSAEITAVVDHHTDEGLYPTAKPRIVAPAGSCSSHIAALCPQNIPAELATLLFCAILIDTDGLKPGGKALDLDRHSAIFLAAKSTYAEKIPSISSMGGKPPPDFLYYQEAVKTLTSNLVTKKADVSQLSAHDLIRRDYKEYTFTLSWAKETPSPSIKAGLSTVPVQLKIWGSDGKLEDAAVTWMQSRGLSVLGILTSYNKKPKRLGKAKGKHERETAWIILDHQGVDTAELATRLWTGLEGNKEISVKKRKKFDLEKGGRLPGGAKAKVYKQGNPKATRKTIAPLLKDILEPPVVATTTAPAAA
ncbi:exopolyphosphatase [Laccaria bicolor S238N-H82]|uniref:Exopolyphosphatase n=1 Tax=Laccaria bicolor (strain S238N-H82 / ATCC MYA-4686) TaxID=486041 RepID=B0D4K7_LACBS|nr:exopolyphosphatase [Laccaria bicolor S238N-H82]EDR10579.1 exopolyphosphatase [Laccaria bicolor S238N-H82]|eukprot:XP_001879029.1 exopolyphosphatase [Laccaria bicolor S238N-H82]